MGKLRAKTGLASLDLPTESQWEYACRAGTPTALNSGYNLTNIDSDAHMDEVGRYWYNGGSNYPSDVGPEGATALVGSYQANAWGLYDMLGNVYEWCLDWYGTYPETAVDPVGPESWYSRVVRGGSWNYGASSSRSANRDWFRSFHAHWCYGFRVAMTLP